MGNRLSKIYTRSGDSGTTGLGDGSRIAKDSPRIEAIGCIDELNSLVGILIAEEAPEEQTQWLTDIQHRLFDLGGEMAVPGYTSITDEHVSILEKQLDQLNETLPPLKEFILPGGSKQAAQCHLARAVCRRSERRVTLLANAPEEKINPAGLKYLNRLSDLLFVMARTLARANGGSEVLWDKSR